MINIKAIDNTKNSQSLLPAFTETTDIKGDSFKSLMEDMKEKNNLFSSSYSSNEVDVKSYGEKNSYSSYSEKNSVSPYSSKQVTSYNDKNNTSIYAKKNNRYDEDRQAYEAVENKSYSNDNNVGRKNRKEENTIEGKNILEKRDVKNLGQTSQNTVNETSTAPQEEIVHVAEEYKQEEISMKDLLLLLQTASKQSSDSELNLKDTENVDAGLMIEDLEISEELKQTLKNILDTLNNLPQDDLADISEYLNNASSNLELLNTQNIDETSILSKLSEALMNGSDDESLESAFAVLQERVASLKGTKDITNTDELFVKDNENLQEILVETENNKGLDNEALSKIINDIASLIDKAVNEKDNAGNEKLTLAKDILSFIKTSLKELESSNVKLIESNTDESVEQVVEDVLEMENIASNSLNMQGADDLVVDTDAETTLISNNLQNKDLKSNVETELEKTKVLPEMQTENVEEVVDETLQLTGNKETLKQNIPVKNEVVSSNNSKTFQEELGNVKVIESVDEAVKSLNEENIQQVETEETATIKEASEKITKDTAKQSDVLTVKDIKKEFKTANVEVSESLRGQAQEKIDAKSNTVNLSDTSKGLANNNSQKEFTTMQNKAGENFSANTQDKGNNFNYFLKSSSEANAKYETAQAKETQAPYNMKDVRDIERLVRTMQSSVSKGQSKLTVVLTPENLGKLQIQLTETGGKITAKFLSDNEQSHKLIMAQSDMFKNQLSEKGIVIDNMEFAFNDTMSKGQNSDEQGRRTSKQTQKGRNFRVQDNDLEVGTEVANKKASGIYA